MITVSPAQLTRLRPLFTAEHLEFVVDAMVAGNTAVTAWADDLRTPRAALLWDQEHNVYVAGPVEHAQRWRDLFREQIAATGPGFLKLHIGAAAADTVFGGYQLQRRDRVLYRAATTHATGPSSAQIPDGFTISSINEAFEQLRGLRNLDAVVEEIESCWPSLERFHRSGFGYVAHDTSQIVSWCTAECVSSTACGIGIETLPAHQGRGLATLTAHRFLKHCTDHSTIAYWDAWAENAPSVAVAEKIGLTKVETYSIYTGTFQDMTAA